MQGRGISSERLVRADGGPACGDPEMLDMGDRLFEHLSHVLVMKLVHHPATLARTNHQPEVTQQAQLVGNGRRLHSDCLGEVAD